MFQLLTRLVFERGSTDAAGKVAEIMSADFVHEVISACVPPVYPPRSGHGWACIPVVPTSPNSFPERLVLSPSSGEAKPNCYIRSSSIPGVPLYPLNLDIVKHLVKLSPVRAVLACVFGSSLLFRDSNTAISPMNNRVLQTPDADWLFYEFALDQSERLDSVKFRLNGTDLLHLLLYKVILFFSCFHCGGRFPTLNRWIQMQSNLHRVSEFAVLAEHKIGNDADRSETTTSVKRFRENDGDSESEFDEIAVSNKSTLLPDNRNEGNEVSDPLLDSLKPEGGEVDTTVFLSFDWENEAPYEKAVERYCGSLVQNQSMS